MTESKEKKLQKKLWSRCYMRLKRKLRRKPTKEEMEDCTKEELYRERLGIIKEKRSGRPTSEEDFFDTMGKTPQTEEVISDEEMRRFLQRRRAREDLEDLATLRKLNEGLSEWGSNEEARPTHEEEMKNLERTLNAELEKRSWEDICPRCKSSVCRCQENE